MAIDWATTAACYSTQGAPFLEEMQQIMRQMSAQQKVLDSSATFAAMSIVCPTCKRTAKFDEQRQEFLVCYHMMSEMRRQFSTAAAGPTLTPSSFDGFRVTVVEPEDLRPV